MDMRRKSNTSVEDLNKVSMATTSVIYDSANFSTLFVTFYLSLLFASLEVVSS